MNKRFIKLPSDESDKWLIDNPDYLWAYVYLAKKASWGGKGKLPQGVVVFSYRRMGSDLAWYPNRVKRFVEKLIKNNLAGWWKTGKTVDRPLEPLAEPPMEPLVKHLMLYASKAGRGTMEPPMEPLVEVPLDPLVEPNTKKEEEGPKNITTIVDFWNAQKPLPEHRDIQKFKPQIQAKLKHYSVEEIKKAIQNYSTILEDPKYRFTHRWSLDQFLKQSNAFDKFADTAKPFETQSRVEGYQPEENNQPEYPDHTKHPNHWGS